MRRPKNPQPNKKTKNRKVAGKQAQKHSQKKNESNGQTVFSMVILTLSLTSILMGFSLFRPTAQPISQTIQIDAPEIDKSAVNIPIVGPTVSVSVDNASDRNQSG